MYASNRLQDQRLYCLLVKILAVTYQVLRYTCHHLQSDDAPHTRYLHLWLLLHAQVYNYYSVTLAHKSACFTNTKRPKLKQNILLQKQWTVHSFLFLLEPVDDKQLHCLLPATASLHPEQLHMHLVHLILALAQRHSCYCTAFGCAHGALLEYRATSHTTLLQCPWSLGFGSNILPAPTDGQKHLLAWCRPACMQFS